MTQGIFVGVDLHVAEAAFGIAKRAIQQFVKVILGEGAQFENLRARYERRVDEKKRIVGGGANEANDAALDIGQEDVLLRFVEAMNFVDEQNCGLTGVLETIVRGGEDAAHVGYVGFHTAEALEL